MAHKWARWLLQPCRMGVAQHFGAGDKNRSGPQVGGLATSPVQHRGSRMLHIGGQNQNWPTSGQIGNITLAAWGGPQHFTTNNKIRGGPQVGRLATSLPAQGRGVTPESRRRWVGLGAVVHWCVCSLACPIAREVSEGGGGLGPRKLRTKNGRPDVPSGTFRVSPQSLWSGAGGGSPSG